MKKTIFILLGFILFSLGVMAQKDSTKVAKFKWLQTEVIDLGQIPNNVPDTVYFEFKNEGKVSLIIQSVQTSCGCASFDYSKEPIEPRKKGFVKVVYNAANMGFFTKHITVKSNATQPTVVLQIKGEVIKK